MVNKSFASPLVSVWMITYNHEKYIAQAIEGVLMQKTNFKIELVIGEDCSTDNTANIVKEYAKKYPEIIKARYNKPNMGMIPNMIKTLEECTGKYVAMCEGDDYWTDPYKLQKQVDFLEKNEDYSICFHKVLVKEGQQITDQYKNGLPLPKDTSTINDLAKGNFINTPSILFRRKSLPNDLPNYMMHAPIGDYPLLLTLAMQGKIKFLNESMAIYRKHPSSAWSSKTFEFRHKKIIEYLEALIGNFPEEINRQFIERHGRYCWDLFNYYSELNDNENARKYFEKGLQYDSKDFFNLVLNMKKKYDLITKIPFYNLLAKIKRTLK